MPLMNGAPSVHAEPYKVRTSTDSPAAARSSTRARVPSASSISDSAAMQPRPPRRSQTIQFAPGGGHWSPRAWR